MLPVGLINQQENEMFTIVAALPFVCLPNPSYPANISPGQQLRAKCNGSSTYRKNDGSILLQTSTTVVYWINRCCHSPERVDILPPLPGGLRVKRQPSSPTVRKASKPNCSVTMQLTKPRNGHPQATIHPLHRPMQKNVHRKPTASPRPTFPSGGCS